jgi:hypothetical protein
MISKSLSELDEIRPKLVPSLRAGLEAVASHVWLILLPVVLDICLWIAPHLEFKSLLEPTVEDVLKFAALNPQQAATIPAAKEMFQILLERTNLLFAFKTYPVGIPSLFSGLLPAVTPLGKPIAIALDGGGQMISLWFILVLAGLIASSLYFSQISRVTAKNAEEHHTTPGVVGWLTLQLLLLSILMVIVILFFGFPAMLVVSAVALMSPGLANIALFFAGMAALWLLVPLVFSAHGIFTHHLPVFRSINASIQIVRLTYSGTGLFLLVCVLLEQGLNQLWMVPPENSWLLLVGILGHSFISTSLIAASFCYYRDGVHLYQTILAKAQPQAIS